MKFFLFLWSKTAIYLSLNKDAQTTEAFSSQKRTSSTSTHEISLLFFLSCGSFLPSWIRIQHLKIMWIHADLDPKPWLRRWQLYKRVTIVENSNADWSVLPMQMAHVTECFRAFLICVNLKPVAQNILRGKNYSKMRTEQEWVYLFRIYAVQYFRRHPRVLEWLDEINIASTGIIAWCDLTFRHCMMSNSITQHLFSMHYFPTPSLIAK